MKFYLFFYVVAGTFSTAGSKAAGDSKEAVAAKRPRRLFKHTDQLIIDSCRNLSIATAIHLH